MAIAGSPSLLERLPFFEVRGITSYRQFTPDTYSFSRRPATKLASNQIAVIAEIIPSDGRLDYGRSDVPELPDSIT